MNVSKYTDPNSKVRIDAYIDREQKEIVDNDPGIADGQLFDIANRVKWKSIKDFIVDTLCKAPLPGDTFVLFRTIKRADDSTIVTWLNEITDVKTEGHGPISCRYISHKRE